MSPHMFMCEQERVGISKCAYVYLCILVPCTCVCLLNMFLCTCLYKQESMHMFLYAYLCIWVHACEIRSEFAFICAHLCPHGQECAYRCACVSVCILACVCGFWGVWAMCTCEYMCVCTCVCLSVAESPCQKPAFLMGLTSAELVCLPGSGAACGMTDPFSSFLLPGPASDHPSGATATGPTVFNGKESPKHPQLAKGSLSAPPRPSGLGRAAVLGGAGALPQGTWDLEAPESPVVLVSCAC